MKERGILFSGSMVRAILEERKTETRRPLRPARGRQSEWLSSSLLNAVPRMKLGRSEAGTLGVALEHPRGGPLGWIDCPYGAPGDRLWVRETWGLRTAHDTTDWLRGPAPKDPPADWIVDYRADWGPVQEGCLWRPSIFLPHWASRITLEVEEVRVERLREITAESARAEGLSFVSDGAAPYGIPGMPTTWNGDPRESFRALWDSINAERAPWDSSPWVWVVRFKRVADGATA